MTDKEYEAKIKELEESNKNLIKKCLALKEMYLQATAEENYGKLTDIQRKLLYDLIDIQTDRVIDVLYKGEN